MGSAYDQLADTAELVREAAVVADLDMKGIKYKNGRLTSDNRSLNDESLRTLLRISEETFAGVPAMFTPFLGMPDPGGIRGYATAIQTAAKELNNGDSGTVKFGIMANPDLGGFDRVAGLVKDWYGGAALEFKQKYLTRWPGVTANQFELVVMLMCAAQAEAAIWENARKNVAEIADSGIHALDALRTVHMCDNADGKLGFQLTVLASIGAIAAAVTGGVVAPLVLTIVGEVASSAGAFPYKQPKQEPITGGDAVAVVGSIQSALDKLKAEIIDGEKRVKDGLETGIQAISANRDLVIVRRPMLADTTPRTIKDDAIGLGTAED